MPNIVQKIIYNLSATAPLCVVFSLVWYIQKGTWLFPLALVITAFLLYFLLCTSFQYGQAHLAPIPIRTSDISPNDGWIIAYVIAYLLPFANFVIEEFDLRIVGVIALFLILAAPCINTAIPNPILFARKYHFYQISAENGVSGYVLISKRKLRKKQDLKKVQRLFEFLLIDCEGI